jgi:hypothetical protein
MSAKDIQRYQVPKCSVVSLFVNDKRTDFGEAVHDGQTMSSLHVGIEKM